MENLPLVSIAICTYNGELFLRQQLETLINQTYHNIEIVAVDDCSDDNTFQILSDYAAKFPQLRIFKNEINLGFADNFQRALNFCNGELIALCDQDDLWDVKKIELQVEAIGDHILLYHDSEFINDEGEPLHKKMSDLFNFYEGGDSEAFLFFNCVSGHTILFKRELMQFALPLKKDAYHDWWLAYVATNIGTISYLPQPLVQYRQHSNSDTDLLLIKNEEKDRYRHQTTTQLYLNRVKWLGYCQAFEKNKRPALVREIYNLYTSRPGSFLSLKFAVLLEKYCGTLFYIMRGSKFKKQSEILKFAWGYKAKNFWYTYIKPKKEKILRVTNA